MKRILEGNTALKIASVLIALFLWLFINSRGVSEITMTVPLEIMNLPTEYQVVSNKATEVNIGLRGHERLIKTIRVQSIRVVLDLSKPKEGWGIYYINKENIRTPRAVEIIKIDPSAIKLKIEKKITKTVSVRPELHGKLPRGYSVEKVVIDPPDVTVEGATSTVNKMKEFRTESIDISGKTESFEEEVFIITNGENLKLSTDKAKVTISIQRGAK